MQSYIFCLCFAALTSAQAQTVLPQTQRPTLPTAPEPTFTGPCAVLYGPTDAKIERMKRAGEDNFYIVADDAMYYSAQTRDYLQKRRLKVLDTAAPQLRFRTATGTVYRVDLRSDTFAWGVLLFDGQHQPVQGNLVEPEANAKAIFKK
jgi:hypothetical protein